MNWEDIIAALSANTQRAPIPQRQQTPPVIGPGGVTSPPFIPNEVMQNFRPVRPQPASPEVFRGPLHASPLRIDQTASRMPAPAMIDAYTQAPRDKFRIPNATEELTPEYMASRQAPMATAHYRGYTQPNGSMIRTSDIQFDPVREAPEGSFRPIQQGEDDDAAWNAAHERVQRALSLERQNTNARLPRPGRPLIGQAWAETAMKNVEPGAIPRGRIYRNPGGPLSELPRRGGS
jgi:hypothetical protein